MSEPTVAELEKKLAARDKVIRVLMEQAEDRIAGSATSMLAQNVGLERIVRQKTSELAAALEALKRTQGELTQANKLTAIGQLAAGVAHEINTPVQYVTDNTHFVGKAIAALDELLVAHQTLLVDLGDAVPDEARDVLARAAKKARLEYLRREVPRALAQTREGLARVATIVGAMKTFSHSSGGEMARVDLREAITSTVTIARNEWKYVAELETSFDPTLDAVSCLRDEMNQVILNLVVNAAHAIAEQRELTGESKLGRIEVATRAGRDFAEIRVSDTGCGIARAHRERIFEPFFTTKPVGKGSGQGLAIAYSVIVKKHHGTIDVESEVGRGTTFVIRIPHRTASTVEAP